MRGPRPRLRAGRLALGRIKDTPLPGTPRPTLLALRRSISELAAALGQVEAKAHSLDAAIGVRDINLARTSSEGLAAYLRGDAARASEACRTEAFHVGQHDEEWRKVLDGNLWPVLRRVDLFLVRATQLAETARAGLRETRVDLDPLVMTSRSPIGPNWEKARAAIAALVVSIDTEHLQRDLDRTLLLV